jgi:1-deoxy-D-xylulose-5-phosphate synthase
VLPVVPELRLAAPRDSEQLRVLLRETTAVTSGSTAIRYPKSSVGPAIPAVRRAGHYDVLREATDAIACWSRSACWPSRACWQPKNSPRMASP